MADVVAVAEVLPRMPSLDSIALLKSSAENRKLYNFRPERVRTALKWLKRYNRFYEDVEIDFSLLDRCKSYEPPSMDMNSDEEEDLDECGEHEVGCDTEVMVMASERVEDATDGIVEGLTGRPIVTRPNPERPTYIYPDSDKFFYEKAFPQLYPYGYGGPGDNHGLKNDPYCDHVLCLGGDRRFQKSIGFIFTNLRYSMSRKISGVCVKAASSCNVDDEEGGIEENDDDNGNPENGNIDAAMVRKYWLNYYYFTL